MNYTKFFRQFKLPALALAAFALAAMPSFAAELAAVPAEWLPPGGTAGVDEIPMWAFVDAGTDANLYTCPDTPVPWTVGPQLTDTVGSLTVNLKNCLADPVSIFVPGQLKETSPVMFTDPQGRSRVRSFDAETAAGAVGTYIWTGVKEGTYLYHSGTHPQVQVQMGLYGALTVGNYGFANEATLVYSEIDPALHAAVADGTYGTPAGPTSTFDYKPRYFLINGAAFPDTTDIAVNTITDLLLRFVNAGLKTRVPTLEGGLYMSLIAEDGNPYPFEMEQYGLELQAAKTIDVVVNVETAGTYALYDRALGLTNWMDTGGGMLTYIVAGTAVDAPTAVADPATAGAYTIAEDAVGGLVVTAPGVLGNDLAADGIGPIPATYEATLISDVSDGTLALVADGSFTYAPDSNFNGTDSFTYQAVDTAATPGPNSNVATVTITVTPVNNPPVANDDTAKTLPDTAVTIDVVANDTDPDGNLDPTTANTDCVTGTPVCAGPANGTLVNNGNGTFGYTPNPAYTGPDTFVYEVCDTGDDGAGLNALCDTATVTITVSNTAPVANDDVATTPGNTPKVIDVVVNDTDVDGNLDPTSVIVTVGPGNGTVTNLLDGTILYTSTTGFIGTDTFQYTVDDDLGATSNVATVTIEVTNSPPVANDDFATTTRNTAVTFSVTANDVDADGSIAVATVDLDPDTAGRQTTVMTPRGGTATVDAFGFVTFDPKRGFRGTDLFQYTVQDNVGALSNVATVRINVVK